MASLLALLSIACTSHGPINWTHKVVSASSSYGNYDATRVRWTRHTTAYRNLESTFFVRATLLSPAFIEAYGRELGRVSGMDASHIDRLKSRLAGANEGQVRFLLTMRTAEPEWNDLETGTASMTVQLASGSIKNSLTKAEDIAVITNDEMADLRTMFTGIDPMAKGYFVSFPLPASLKTLILRISGQPTYADLQWKIQR